jgi:adenylyl-sulfate kinase
MSIVSLPIMRRKRRGAANVVWQDGIVDRQERWDVLGTRGGTVWFTGLSGSGKSTTAAAVEAQLLAEGRWAYRLDGDNLRHRLCSDLSFDRQDRAENVRRVAETALLFADAGAIALVCLVSPYRADRALVRELHEQAGLDYLEVYVSTSLAECARRDVKGLYARAERGDINDLTGIGAPYEPPTAPDIEIDERLDIDAASRLVLVALTSR